MKCTDGQRRSNATPHAKELLLPSLMLLLLLLPSLMLLFLLLLLLLLLQSIDLRAPKRSEGAAAAGRCGRFDCAFANAVATPAAAAAAAKRSSSSKAQQQQQQQQQQRTATGCVCKHHKSAALGSIEEAITAVLTLKPQTLNPKP